jgi:serine/threonine protein kinase
VYGLGATLYHLVSGHDPCKPPYMKYPISHWNPGLPPGLEKLIGKCTKANPFERYSSCGEIDAGISDLQKKLRRRSDQGYTEIIAAHKSDWKIETDITIVFTNEIIQ